jgi:hypothetical protein
MSDGPTEAGECCRSLFADDPTPNVKEETE